jgi:hypothetical protein
LERDGGWGMDANLPTKILSTLAEICKKTHWKQPDEKHFLGAIYFTSSHSTKLK